MSGDTLLRFSRIQSSFFFFLTERKTYFCYFVCPSCFVRRMASNPKGLRCNRRRPLERREVPCSSQLLGSCHDVFCVILSYLLGAKPLRIIHWKWKPRVEVRLEQGVYFSTKRHPSLLCPLLCIKNDLKPLLKTVFAHPPLVQKFLTACPHNMSTKPSFLFVKSVRDHRVEVPTVKEDVKIDWFLGQL